MSDQSSPDSPAITVLEALAEREGTETTDLPPLNETIDLEALDRLFAPKYDGTPRDGGHVRFSYADYLVTVHGDGRVELDDGER